jgi:hypothetical protein
MTTDRKLTYWIYFRDGERGWMPACSLPFSNAADAERVLDALATAHPAREMRLEHA